MLLPVGGFPFVLPLPRGYTVTGDFTEVFLAAGGISGVFPFVLRLSGGHTGDFAEVLLAAEDHLSILGSCTEASF